MIMSARIIATDETIREIVKSEIDRLGNQADLNHVDVSRVTDMTSVFESKKFDGNISEWDVSKVKSMKMMFADSKFNGDISRWDTSNVENMHQVFVSSLFNGDISRWHVSKVERMRGMFAHSKFTGEISDWDVSNVISMNGMFYGSAFNGTISQWNVSSVKDMNAMFLESKFNGDISQWNVRDDCNVAYALSNSPSETHPSFGKLHFMAEAQDESIVLHPNAEVAYATFMPMARAMYPNESGAVQAARAWEAYQASLSASDSYDYTVALNTEWTG